MPKATIFNVCLPCGKAVLVAEDLLIAGHGAPEVDAAKLLHAVEIHVGAAAVRVGAADQPHLVSLELETDASARRVGDMQLSARSVGRFYDRPCPFVLQPIVLGHLLRIVALDNHAAASVVTNRHECNRHSEAA